jgi:alpha-tubulin suppressor-like RCC1 family protein
MAWGANTHGQANIPPHKKVIQVATGWRHSLALQEDGTVIAWGDNSDGQCAVPAGLTDVIQISSGTRHSIALKRDGTVIAWGANHFGQCDAPSDLGPVARLAELCAEHTVVITENGKLAAWGRNDTGDSAVPTSAIGNASVIKVWSGGENFALLDDGRLLHWGRPLRNDQLPPETAGVSDIYSGFTAAILVRKTDGTINVHGAVKDHPSHGEVLKDWDKIIISPSYIYGLLEEDE